MTNSNIFLANIRPPTREISMRLPSSRAIGSSHTSRRAFLIEGASLAVATTCLSSCSLFEAGSPTTLLKIQSVSTTSPTALTAISLKLSGFNPNAAFTVALTTGQSAPMPQTPISVGSDGTVFIGVPLYLDGSKGTTSSWNATLTVTQNGQSDSVALDIQDLPALSVYGLPVGTISRAFLNHQEIALGLNINAHQALSLRAKAVPSNAKLAATFKSRLNNVILARNDVDRVVTNNSISIVGGTTSAGTQIAFNATALAMMDRVLAQYLLAFSPTITSLNVSSTGARDKAEPTAAISFPTFVNGLNTLTGVTGFIQGQVDLASQNADAWKQGMAVLGIAGSVLAVGGIVLGLGAAATGGAAVLAGAATAAETLSQVLGLLSAAAAGQHDIIAALGYGYNALTTSGAQQQTNIALGLNAIGMVGVDAIQGYLSAEGLGSAGSVIDSILMPVEKDGYLAATGLLAAADSVVLDIQQDALDASNSISSISPSDQFLQIDGSIQIANSQGPVLSGLTGVELGNAGSGTFSLQSLADGSGDYSLICPLASSDLTYSNMDFAAYDPISDEILSSQILNLSGASGTINGPTLKGTCTDTDAGAPDADDPDCDFHKGVSSTR